MANVKNPHHDRGGGECFYSLSKNSRYEIVSWEEKNRKYTDMVCRKTERTSDKGYIYIYI